MTVAIFQSSGKEDVVKQWLIICVRGRSIYGRRIFINLTGMPSSPIAFEPMPLTF